MMRHACALLGLLVLPGFGALEFKDTEGKYLDLLSEGKVLVRYMYEHDTSTEEAHHATYKPYLHVFDSDGKAPITKGPGGQFTHHRGIFIGWSQIGFNGKKYDRWHMKGGDIVHQKFIRQEVDAHSAVFTSVTHWMDESAQAFLEEERTFTIKTRSDHGRALIDFESKLTPLRGDVSLKGDPEHAGIQYRPADEVDKKKTKYLFANGVTQVRGQQDLPWAAENYTLHENRYGVVHLNHPENPKGTVYSAYRDYGRFGAFFEKDIKQGDSLCVHYGFLILDGELPKAEEIQKVWNRWSQEKK